MRIIIVEAEIKIAIQQYVLGQLNIAKNQTITVEFKNTRGPEGSTAEIEIVPVVASNQPVTRTVDTGPVGLTAADTAAIIANEPEPVTTRRSVFSGKSLEPTQTVIEQLAVANIGETEELPNPSTEAAPVAEAGSTTATVEESPVEPASSTSETVTSSETEAPLDLTRTVPFDADQPVDAEVKAPAKSLFANLTRPANKPS